MFAVLQKLIVVALAVTFTACVGPSQPGNSLNVMIQNLEQGSQAQKLEAARQLSRRGDIAVWPLQKALRDPDWAVRGAAAHALGEIGSPARAAVPDLLKATNDDYSYVSDQARLALERITASSR